jgi:hypothetical protein
MIEGCIGRKSDEVSSGLVYERSWSMVGGDLERCSRLEVGGVTSECKLKTGGCSIRSDRGREGDNTVIEGLDRQLIEEKQV